MPLKTPLVPMKLFKIRDFSIAVIVGSVGQMAYYALNIIWPGQITNLYTTDNLTIGWMSVRAEFSHLALKNLRLL